MKKIFLITKLKTTNIGNEALSHEIIIMFKELVPGAVININGRPAGLDGYLPSKLYQAKDPIQAFETWTDHIVRKIKQEPDVQFKANQPKVVLYFEQKFFKRDKWKSKLKPLKRLYYSLLTYSNQYKERARQLKQADWLVYSGAGEVNDQHGNIGNSHVLLRQLIELRVAQKLGVKTAAINQSIFILTPFFQKLAAHVYSKMEKIVVRGNASKNKLIEFGVPANLISTAPDSAVNTIIPVKSGNARSSNRVGVNFPSLSKISLEDIRKIVSHLRAAGKEPVFCTNEPLGDIPMINLLKEELGVEALSPSATYTDYAKKLSEMDFVISARVHTNMLSMVSHTTIIPIEASDFRLAELLEGFEYPLPIIKAHQPGWVEEVIAMVDQIMQDNSVVDNYYNNRFQETRKKTLDNAIWINQYIS
jgi:polysaccharide pyruvyl transferase WcaK-like protein